MSNSNEHQKLLCIVMDGVGSRQSHFGNAVANAKTPNLDQLKKSCFYTELFAHGPHVGLPSLTDMGNSEVGHNALGGGRIVDQGAKLVQNAMKDESVFQSSSWKNICNQSKNKCLHLIGLLSDGNVHSHETHLHLSLIHI